MLPSDVHGKLNPTARNFGYGLWAHNSKNNFFDTLYSKDCNVFPLSNFEHWVYAQIKLMNLYSCLNGAIISFQFRVLSWTQFSTQLVVKLG